MVIRATNYLCRTLIRCPQSVDYIIAFNDLRFNQIVDFLTACGRVLADRLSENNELAFELKQRFVELYVLKSVQGGNALSSTLE